MGNCHYCMNCGRCRGEKPRGFYARRCPACGAMNEQGSTECAFCGGSLLLQSGTTALSPGVAFKPEARKGGSDEHR